MAFLNTGKHKVAEMLRSGEDSSSLCVGPYKNRVQPFRESEASKKSIQHS